MRVVCVLRASAVYTPQYVYKLRDGVRKHLPNAEFVCLTDTPLEGIETMPLRYAWPGWWSKMELFRPDITGDLLYFDLDTVITGDLSDIAALGRDTFLRDFYRGGSGLGSGVMYLTEQLRPTVWREWLKSPPHWMERYRRGGDQAFLERFYTLPAKRFQDLLPRQIVSFKAHCRRSLPAGARVVCYHGKPKPHNTGWATHG